MTNQQNEAYQLNLFDDFGFETIPLLGLLKNNEPVTYHQPIQKSGGLSPAKKREKKKASPASLKKKDANDSVRPQVSATQNNETRTEGLSYGGEQEMKERTDYDLCTVEEPKEEETVHDNVVYGNFKQYKNYVPNYRVGEEQTVYPISDRTKLREMASWLMENKDPKLALAFMLGVNVGLRANELLSLRWGDLLNEDGTVKYIEDTGDSTDVIRVRQSKTSKTRKIYLNRACRDAIEWYIAVTGGLYGHWPCGSAAFDFLPTGKKGFAHAFTAPLSGERSKAAFLNEYVFPNSASPNNHLTVDYLRKVIKSAAQACGVKQNIGTHTLRKTFGWFVATTSPGLVKYDVTQLQRIFGHSNQDTTLRYIGFLDVEDKALYHRMAVTFTQEIRNSLEMRLGKEVDLTVLDP